MLNGVAVIPVYGVIYRHATYMNDLIAWAFGGASVDSIADADLFGKRFTGEQGGV